MRVVSKRWDAHLSEGIMEAFQQTIYNAIDQPCGQREDGGQAAAAAVFFISASASWMFSIFHFKIWKGFQRSPICECAGLRGGIRISI